jgi:hypothetical protein
MHFAATLLTIPQLFDGSRAVKISPDQRQALCYQCHAPRQPETNTIAATIAIPELLYPEASALKSTRPPGSGDLPQLKGKQQLRNCRSKWGPQIGSGDDRTPIGVHEGISCFSCHTGHNESATGSCKTCHPQMSHCGLDVEKMDTTFANAKSAHNIHWVKCAGCHQRGVPKPKTSVQSASLSAAE